MAAELLLVVQETQVRVQQARDDDRLMALFSALIRDEREIRLHGQHASTCAVCGDTQPCMALESLAEVYQLRDGQPHRTWVGNWLARHYTL